MVQKLLNKGLYLLLVLFLTISTGIRAQISTTSYNNNLVKKNSIVVTYDNRVISAKGKTTTPTALAATLRTEVNASIERTIKGRNIEEWTITGDLEQTLERLNRIPGVKAFPNYVFQRDEMEMKKLENDIRRITDDLRISPKSNILPGFGKKVLEVGSLEYENVIYSESFDDTATAASNWSVIDYTESGVVWDFAPDGEGGYLFYVENTTGDVAEVATDLYSPAFDFSDIDTSSLLLLSLDLDYEYLNESTYVGLYFEEQDSSGFVGTGGFDLTGESGRLYFNISNLIGKVIRFDIYVEDESLPNEAIASFFDNVEINQYASNDNFITEQYGLNNDGSFNPGYSVPGADVSAFDAWQTNKGSDDVIVVVYDDGVDFDHPDLYSNAWMNPAEAGGTPGVDDDGNGYVDDIYGWSSVYNNNWYINPGSFHGTHVAGIIGAQGGNEMGISGVSQDVSIISVMIFDEYGYTDALSIMAGYDYISTLLAEGVEITAINQSWGGGGYLDLESDQHFVEVMTNFAMEHAEYGALWVISAGNNGSNRDEQPYYSYPNNIQSPNTITVANTDDADELSASSDYGIRTVDLGAPGSIILSTVPGGYAYLSGTSMAAPHVTGAIALAKAEYPDESGEELLVRVLAGTDPVSSLDGMVGEGGRLNVNAALAPSNEGIETNLVASHTMASFHRTFVDDAAYKVIGFVNNTDNAVEVSGVSITDDTDDVFWVDEEVSFPVTVPAGGAFGVNIGFMNETYGEFTATATITTDAGDVSINLNGREQGFSWPSISPEFTDLGAVPYGTQLSTSFTLSNNGDAPLEYNIVQSLFYYDLEFSELLESIDMVQPTPSIQKTPVNRNQVEFFDDLTARVMLARGDQPRQKIKYQPSTEELLGDVVIWEDDLENPEEVAENWDILNYGESDMVWELYSIMEVEEDTNNVFLFGDFENGYENLSLPIAIAPSFDFTELDAHRMPAYLKFDVAVDMEQDYDVFYVNVISHGSRLGTIVGSYGEGGINNDGSVHTVMVDIAFLSGLDDVEFWFIANTDETYTEGFGAMFDNVQLITTDAPFFPSTYGGEIAAGGSMEIDITINTELLPPGDWVLYSDIYHNGFVSYYNDSYLYHTAEFSSRNVNLDINPEFNLAGEVPADEAFMFQFDATNTGTVEVEYFADVVLFQDVPFYDFISEGFLEARDETIALFETSEKGEGEKFDPGKHRSLVYENLDKRPNTVGQVRPVHSASSMIPTRESMDFYYEDFEGQNPLENWELIDFSYGLGSQFEVENFGTEEDPFNMLDVGGLSENGYYILNNSFSLAYSPTFDLSGTPEYEHIMLEFSYSFLLEPYYDFASVWLGVDDGEEVSFYLLGSSEDVFQNDGFLYRMNMDISWAKEIGEVFLAFVVETDASVQSAWASWDDLYVYSAESAAYITPSEGKIDSAQTQTFEVKVNTPYLVPGYYGVVSFIDYFNEDFWIAREGIQETYFSIPNNKPIAGDDFIAVLSGEAISVSEILDYLLMNDSDPEGSSLYLYDISDPLYGEFKYLIDDYYYVAPLSYTGQDMMQYIVSDGDKTDTAMVYISVAEEPHFPVGSDQQFVFLEDESLTLSTKGMAAGVGSWLDVHVWGTTENSDLILSHSTEEATISFSASENYFGQTEVTLYVGSEIGMMSTAMDSMKVSIIVVPVNDAPTAAFSVSIDGAVAQMTDQSSDALDMTAGGIVAWSWDFGDGATSEERNPSHTFVGAGDYTVTLTVTDNGGLTDTFQQQVPVAVSSETEEETPTVYALEQNYPNPFNPSTVISYSLPEAAKVTVSVYDMLGQKVAELVNREQNAGFHNVSFDASGLSSGVYIYQIRAGNFVQSKKMMLIK